MLESFNGLDTFSMLQGQDISAETPGTFRKLRCSLLSYSLPGDGEKQRKSLLHSGFRRQFPTPKKTGGCGTAR
ncbi:hypothetical protein AAFF_G00033280 [Aldrovandia affinis]|uniref:Uncharacterized protein n=1 Tax=Aldrovandia affinis TaxID=143900 RepID=A0AAD7S3X7_9TELE|nr:hypothetical protein AAFF_G00033280 [Aldrovandia affinis]